MVQSALDDVYKDMGSVTDQLSTRIGSMRKQVHSNREKIETIENKIEKKKVEHQTNFDKIGIIEDRQAKLTSMLRTLNLRLESNPAYLEIDQNLFLQNMKDMNTTKKSTKQSSADQPMNKKETKKLLNESMKGFNDTL